jgi:tetratricopeptide (TPR) repeat protein
MGEPRFGLLETVREFAAEQLETRGEAEAVRARHFDWCLAFAEARQAELRGPRQPIARSRLDLEADNMRAALDWSLARLKSPTGALHGHASLRLGGALARWWSLRGSSSEGSRWLEQLLAAVDANRLADGAADASTVRARVLLGLGWLYSDQGQFGRAQRCHEASLPLFRAAHDQRGMAAALLYLAHLADYHGETNRALDLFTASAEHARAAGDRSRLGEALGWLGWARYRRGELDAARIALLESRTLLEASGDNARLADVLYALGILDAEQNDAAAAERVLRQSFELFQRAGDHVGETKALGWLGYVALNRGDHPAARAALTQCVAWARAADLNKWLPRWLYLLGRLERAEGHAEVAWVSVREGLALHQQMGCPPPAVRGVEAAAGLLAATRTPSATELAVRLFGASAAKRRASGLSLPRAEVSDYDRDVAYAREHLPGDLFARAWQDGEALCFEQAIATVLAVP